MSETVIVPGTLLTGTALTGHIVVVVSDPHPLTSTWVLGILIPRMGPGTTVEFRYGSAPFVIDPDTGQWISKGTLTHEQGLRIAASVLPGIPAELLDRVYSAWLSSDAPQEKATHLVEARVLVSNPESAMLVTGILHGALHGIEPEPLVVYAPLRKGRGGTQTLSLAFAEDSVRVYRDGMVLPS